MTKCGIYKDKVQNEYRVGDLIYDANIYDGLNTFLYDLPFYKKWLPKNQNAQILELCCGSGRLTIPIAKEYNICGVDNSVSMLEQAKLKAGKEGLNIQFVEADIRTLDLPNKFDLIFIPFNSILHLYQNQDLFDTFNVVKKHLKEDGLFLLDCFNPNIHYIVEAELDLLLSINLEVLMKNLLMIIQKSKYLSASFINQTYNELNGLHYIFFHIFRITHLKNHPISKRKYVQFSHLWIFYNRLCQGASNDFFVYTILGVTEEVKKSRM